MEWARRFPSSANNFDLVLVKPQELDSKRLTGLLNEILEITHRRVTLKSQAANEFRRWFDHPETPLKSEAYVLLSNWFMTKSGDRHSAVGTRCEELWDALFPCRPVERLTSPKPGRNHRIIPTQFESFWQRLVDTQREDVHQPDGHSAESNNEPTSRPSEVPQVGDGSLPVQLRARFEKKGLNCEVEGSPRALAEFLRIVSSWESGQKDNNPPE